MLDERVQWSITFHILTIILFEVIEVHTLICLQCNDVVQPRHCHSINYCRKGEVCYVEKYTAKDGVRYNTGCKQQQTCDHWNQSSTAECTFCCNSDFCNSQGCDAPGYPLQRGPICLNCPQEIDASYCYNIAYCRQSEVCHIREDVEFGDRLFATGCKAAYQCPAIISRPNMLRNLSSSHLYPYQPPIKSSHISSSPSQVTTPLSSTTIPAEMTSTAIPLTPSTIALTPSRTTVKPFTTTKNVVGTGVIIVGKREYHRKQRYLECDQCCVGDLCNALCDMSETSQRHTQQTQTTTDNMPTARTMTSSIPTQPANPISVNNTKLTTEKSTTISAYITSGTTKMTTIASNSPLLPVTTTPPPTTLGNVQLNDRIRKCREFLLLFSGHDGYSSSDNITLLVTASSPGNLSIYYPQNNTYENVSLSVGSNIIHIDPDVIVSSFRIEQKGLHVISDVNVTLHVMQYRNVADTGYLALPVGALSRSYVVPTYYALSEADPSQITVGALSNDTRISFKIALRGLKNVTYNGQQYSSGDIINVTLNKYETFQLVSQGDLSGTVVMSNNDISVISGSMFTMVPFSSKQFDAQTLEQMIPPVSSLGSQYIVPPLMDRSNYNVRVISVYPNTSVNIGGNILLLKNVGDYREGIFGKLATDVSSSKPVLVVQYVQTQKTRQEPGSGAMIVVPSLKQFQTEFNFTIPDPPLRPLQTNYKHYLSIVVPGPNADKVYIDGDNYTMYNSNVTSIQTSDGGSFNVVTVEVAPGYHTVKGALPFSLTAYGKDYGQGYGYPVNVQC